MFGIPPVMNLSLTPLQENDILFWNSDIMDEWEWEHEQRREEVPTKIRVLLADDHVVVRQGTKELLEQEKDIVVVGEASDGTEAVRKAMETRPDIVIMDIRMPGMSGIEATKQIRKMLPRTQVLALTAYDDDEFVFSLLKAGASGYLMKTAPFEELVRAIREVFVGHSVLDPAVARKVVSLMSSDQQRQNRPMGLDQETVKNAGLTKREMEVLRMLAEGLSNKEIASKLYISPRTVQTHLSNIFSKMGVSSRTEAVLKALKEGWLEL